MRSEYASQIEHASDENTPQEPQKLPREPRRALLLDAVDPRPGDLRVVALGAHKNEHGVHAARILFERATLDAMGRPSYELAGEWSETTDVFRVITTLANARVRGRGVMNFAVRVGTDHLRHCLTVFDRAVDSTLEHASVLSDVITGYAHGDFPDGDNPPKELEERGTASKQKLEADLKAARKTLDELKQLIDGIHMIAMGDAVVDQLSPEALARAVLTGSIRAHVETKVSYDGQVWAVRK